MTRRPMHAIKTATRGYTSVHDVYVTLRTRPVHVMTIIQDPKRSSLTLEPVLHPNFSVHGPSLRSVLVSLEYETVGLINSYQRSKDEWTILKTAHSPGTRYLWADHLAITNQALSDNAVTPQARASNLFTIKPTQVSVDRVTRDGIKDLPPWVRKYPYITPEDLIYVLIELVRKVLDPKSSAIGNKTPWAARVHRLIKARRRRMTQRPKCSMTRPKK